MKFPLSVFIVVEESMVPVFVPGDHVVVFAWAGVKVGDVVVFNYEKDRHIKRVTKKASQRFFVVGDNKRKSAKYKEIRKKDLVGKVIFKY